MLHLRRFARSESGATAVEYTLIGIVMAVAILAIFPMLEEPLTNLATDIAAAIKPD
ncbi:Flp family type IVb pilin [Aurantimonas sp. 22II-16-19i]|uniref:Flp family type IVb pilin n=1 Tax=Aurantimonas sp. 22II-16-19i TaxID=1317114 RepID=UPI001AEC837A|nr:Flp family type IVb pilin [Aurantimonas sp. 22II-16-19i]